MRTENGSVILPDGNSIPYTELAADAAGIKPSLDPPLKPREQWTLLGKSQPRVDMVEKCTGTALYASDVRLPWHVERCCQAESANRRWLDWL